MPVKHILYGRDLGEVENMSDDGRYANTHACDGIWHTYFHRVKLDYENHGKTWEDPHEAVGEYYTRHDHGRNKPCRDEIMKVVTKEWGIQGSYALVVITLDESYGILDFLDKYYVHPARYPDHINRIELFPNNPGGRRICLNNGETVMSKEWETMAEAYSVVDTYLDNQQGEEEDNQFEEFFKAEPAKVRRWFINHIHGKFTGTTWEDLDNHMDAYGIDPEDTFQELLFNMGNGQWGFEPEE